MTTASAALYCTALYGPLVSPKVRKSWCDVEAFPQEPRRPAVRGHLAGGRQSRTGPRVGKNGVEVGETKRVESSWQSEREKGKERGRRVDRVEVGNLEWTCQEGLSCRVPHTSACGGGVGRERKRQFNGALEASAPAWRPVEASAYCAENSSGTACWTGDRLNCSAQDKRACGRLALFLRYPIISGPLVLLFTLRALSHPLESARHVDESPCHQRALQGEGVESISFSEEGRIDSVDSTWSVSLIS